MLQSSLHGRGAGLNPAGRFERLEVELEPDPDLIEPDAGGIPTIYLRDTSRTIISENDSPDVGFRFSVNPYRGCEHGCIYCYARPTHEYLDLSAGLDFERKVLVKEQAPQLLREALARPSYRCESLAFSGVTDCYQPVERKLQLTRRCIEVLSECRHPMSVITKSHLITRDMDLLGPMGRDGLAVAFISLTTLDVDVARRMEPRAASPQRRLDAIAQLAAAGVPVGVMMAPVVPGLTDHEILPLLKAAREAGAAYAGYLPLRLPYGVKDLFDDWLARHFPDRRDKVLNRVRHIRGGKLNDSNFHTRMRGEGIYAEQMRKTFRVAHQRFGYGSPPPVRTDLFRRPMRSGQMSLW